jgi:subtilisin family serine protease
VKSGVVFVVAAGNENQNACNVSPSNVPEAITVGATTRTDNRASYSNFGKCVDIFAPGSSITSAWRTNDTATSTISGTSMASPHVAGVVALYLEQYPKATPSEIDALVKKNATPNIVKSPGTASPNLFIYSNPAAALE